MGQQFLNTRYCFSLNLSQLNKGNLQQKALQVPKYILQEVVNEVYGPNIRYVRPFLTLSTICRNLQSENTNKYKNYSII